MENYELIIENNKVSYIHLLKDKKVNMVDLADIDDFQLLEKVDLVNGWLKVHPLGNYIMDEKEYQDYRLFMVEKRYLIDCSNVKNPLIQKIKETIARLKGKRI